MWASPVLFRVCIFHNQKCTSTKLFTYLLLSAAKVTWVVLFCCCYIKSNSLPLSHSPSSCITLLPITNYRPDSTYRSKPTYLYCLILPSNQPRCTFQSLHIFIFSPFLFQYNRRRHRSKYRSCFYRATQLISKCQDLNLCRLVPEAMPTLPTVCRNVQFLTWNF